MKFDTVSIQDPFFWANPPHNKNTIFSFRSFKYWIIASVNFIHPICEWELASPFRTVNVAFNNNTPKKLIKIYNTIIMIPCLAHPSRHPCFGLVNPLGPKSDSSSLKIFIREGGGEIPFLTEKHSPWAWFGPWYGSIHFK